MRIVALAWKDDSFKAQNWIPQSGTSASTTGDEITLNGTITRTLTESLLPYSFNFMSVRSYSTSSANITINLNYNSTTEASVSFTPATVYSRQGFLLTPIPSNINSIQIISSASATVDYIALADLSAFPNGYASEIDFGGDLLTISANFRTTSQSVPNSTDVIQQLGIASKEYKLQLPKVPKEVYNWLEYLEQNHIPVEFVSNSLSATGYLVNVSALTNWGWVSQPVGQYIYGEAQT
jgi:hypothetical protein